MEKDENEVREVAFQVFNNYDKNKDGGIDIKEMTPLLLKISECLKLPKPTPESISNGMKALDANSNGVLEFEEFYQFYKRIYRELIK